MKLYWILDTLFYRIGTNQNFGTGQWHLHIPTRILQKTKSQQQNDNDQKSKDIGYLFEQEWISENKFKVLLDFKSPKLFGIELYYI